MFSLPETKNVTSYISNARPQDPHFCRFLQNPTPRAQKFLEWGKLPAIKNTEVANFFEFLLFD